MTRKKKNDILLNIDYHQALVRKRNMRNVVLRTRGFKGIYQ